MPVFAALLFTFGACHWKYNLYLNKINRKFTKRILTVICSVLAFFKD